MFLSYAFTDRPPAELIRRTSSALAAYSDAFTVTDAPYLLEREFDRAEARCRANGWKRQLARLAVERSWLEENRATFTQPA